MTALLTLLALALCILGLVCLYTGLRMLRPSARSNLKRNAGLVGTWSHNTRGTIPRSDAPAHFFHTGVVYDKRSDMLVPTRRLSHAALLDVL